MSSLYWCYPVHCLVRLMVIPLLPQVEAVWDQHPVQPLWVVFFFKIFYGSKRCVLLLSDLKRKILININSVKRAGSVIINLI